MNNPFYQEDTSKMKAMIEAWLMSEVIGGLSIVILTEEEGFLFLIMMGEEITQVLIDIG